MTLVLHRRAFLAGAAATLGGCSLSNFTDQQFADTRDPAYASPYDPRGNPGVDMTTTGSIAPGDTGRVAPSIGVDPNLSTSANMYAELNDGSFSLPAIPYKELDQRFRRQRVPNTLRIAPGTILVDTRNHHAYFGLTQDEVVRYGVGVGKAGFEWSGDAVVQLKKEWPVWTPPIEMIDRKPELMKYASGMPGGPDNPLGARSLYLYANGRDTLYRLHGTPEWASIGQSMSSGCIRFLNHDIIDLYNRAPKGTRVRVV
ncbi:MAG: L,D-transpeptidase [Nitratireductor sp.]|nr:L,D-transpeptidase [Nitratireductor sp.]